MDRRSLLATGAMLGGLALSGCLGDGDERSTPTPGATTEGSTPTDTETSTETGTETPTPTTTATTTPGPPDWADHELAIDATDYDGEVNFHLVAGDRIEGKDGPARVFNDGAFGHADAVRITDRIEYYLGGRLLSIKLQPSLVELDVRDVADAPIEVRLDGERIDFERWDPSDGDLPMGYGGVGALPDDLAFTEDDCDFVASNLDDLKGLAMDLEAGSVIGIDGDIHLPEESGQPMLVMLRYDDLTLVGLETDDGSHPTLFRNEGSRGYGNNALTFNGDRTALLNLQLRGPLDHYVEYDEYPGWLQGVDFQGSDSVVLNCHAWHWPHAAFAAGGSGETFLCTDSHHNMLGGLGYGFVTGGPLAPKDWDDGEFWSEAELDRYRPWHRRTEIKRVVMDANRHDVSGGTHTSYELRWFVTGPTAVTGHRIDMHRPGGGVMAVGPGVISESTEGVTNGEKGISMRGYPVIGARIEDTWFTWGEEPDPDHRYPHDTAPIVQVNVVEGTRDRRGVWDNTNGPFKRVEWYDSAFGPDQPDWLSAELEQAYESLPGRWGDVAGP